MGCVVYREGNSHVERGIECEIAIVPNKRVAGYLSSGWFASPEEIIQAEIKEDIDTNGSGKISNKEVRAAAEKAGIEGFESSRIQTLREALGIND